MTSDLAQSVFAPLLQEQSETATQEFSAVPGQGTPRWLVPVRHREIASVLANWAPYRLTSRVKWAAIRTAHRVGCLSALPGASPVKIHGVEDVDWRCVGWSSDIAPVPLVYVGTPGVSRKAVIHLVNPASGLCDLIVKVPLTEAAKAAILREADVLEILADENYNRAPRLVHVDRDGGMTAQTALKGRSGGRKFSDEYWAALRSLMLPGERTTIIGHAMEWQEQLGTAFGCEAEIATMAAAMAELPDAEPVPACWVHGDFAPWNLRRLPDGTVVMLDWEDAQRGGLPLQDAFHFLHMQDYLFGARPTAHATDVECFGQAIGIPAKRCHELEIAYLVRSYLRRQAVGEAGHCGFLLTTLRIVLRGHHWFFAPKAEVAVAGVAEAVRIPKPPFSAQIRSDLFAAVIAQLNSAGVPYCVLSGHENHAAKSSSDVDFMFASRDISRVAPLLAQAARKTGANLIQAIRHETNSWYFVMAKDDGSEIGYFDPDCTTDYRAQGRLWLSAEKMLARRRRQRDLYVPAVADEFTYYLIKKVLKQSIDDFQLRRLRHLYQRDPSNCREEIGRFWSGTTVRGIERALVASDVAWFQSAMPGLFAELKASAPVETLGQRVVQRLRDGMRVLDRILRPTGMFVMACGGEKALGLAIAERLLQQLAPAFRRVAYVEPRSTCVNSLMSSLQLAAKVLAARLRSTLVVSHVGDGKILTRSLSSLAARLLLQPDLTFFVAGDKAKPPGASRDVDFGFSAHKTRVVHLNSGLSTGQNVHQASRTILRWLAARQERRLSLMRESFADPMAESLAKKLEPIS
ncbi:MAG: phosphotransferase family protein [Candidatus Korobacteraceae bacterium]